MSATANWPQYVATSQHRRPEPTSDIRALTGLRGMAAMLVALYHFWPTADLPSNWLRYTVGRGYLWVDLFFVLSGYVMALNYGRLFAGGFSTPVFKEFLVRRIARIYPLYASLLAVQIVYTAVTYGDFQHHGAWAAVAVDHPVRDLSANLLLTQSLGVSPSIIGQAWSISTEFAAYFCFPAFVALIIRGDRHVAAIIGLVAIALLISVAAIDMHDGAYHNGSLDAYDGTRITPLMRCFAGFVLGMLTFRLSLIPLLATLSSRDDVGLFVLAGLIAMLVIGVPDLAIVAIFPLMVLCLSQNIGAFAAIFSNSMMYALGGWSYAVYLLHPLLQKPSDMLGHVLATHLPHDLAIILAPLIGMGVVLILACGAYNFVEHPGRRAIQRVAIGMAPR